MRGGTRVLPVVTALLALCASAALGQAPGATLALPLDVRGLVHRDVFFGCGQAWTDRVATTEVTLAVAANRVARLRLDAQLVDASGGVSALGGTPQPHHGETRRTLHVEWSGRARARGESLVVELARLVETTPVEGSPSGVVVTNRSRLDARVTCTRAPHDLLAPTPPVSPDADIVVGRRPLLSCAFDPVAHEGPLPRPVRDALTPTFFLDAHDGVTTDARYRGYVTDAPERFVAREPGWVEPGPAATIPQ